MYGSLLGKIMRKKIFPLMPCSHSIHLSPCENDFTEDMTFSTSSSLEPRTSVLRDLLGGRGKIICTVGHSNSSALYLEKLFF